MVELVRSLEAGTVTVRPAFTGEPEAGVTALEGVKAHVAPDGNPEHARFTVPLNEPRPKTTNASVVEVVPLGTAMLAGFGVSNAKSTTCKVSTAS